MDVDTGQILQALGVIHGFQSTNEQRRTAQEVCSRAHAHPKAHDIAFKLLQDCNLPQYRVPGSGVT